MSFLSVISICPDNIRCLSAGILELHKAVSRAGHNLIAEKLKVIGCPGTVRPLKSLKLKISKVTVDGVDFYLRELSGKARLDFEGEKDLQLRVLKMMHASLCDENGNLTEKPKDFDAFMESVPNKVLNALVNAFSALNITGETHLKN